MKNLETEYRNSQQEETPDLWNRIEAALPEKATAMPTQTSKKKVIQFTRFVKAAAAILVLALVVPGAWFLMTQGKNGAQNDYAVAMDTAGNNASMDMAADYELPAADVAAPEEMSNGTAPENMQDEKPQADITTDSAMQEVGANAENSEMMSGQADGGTMTEDITDGESLSEAAGQSPMEDGIQSEAVPLEESVFMTVDEIARDHGRTFYYLCDESGTIYIAVWEETSVDTENVETGETGALGELAPEELQVGESYYFTMQEAVGKDWDYEICDVE